MIFARRALAAFFTALVMAKISGILAGAISERDLPFVWLALAVELAVTVCLLRRGLARAAAIAAALFLAGTAAAALFAMIHGGYTKGCSCLGALQVSRSVMLLIQGVGLTLASAAIGSRAPARA